MRILRNIAILAVGVLSAVACSTVNSEITTHFRQSGVDERLVTVLDGAGASAPGARIEARNVFTDHGMNPKRVAKNTTPFDSSRTNSDGVGLISFDPDDVSYILCRLGEHSAASFPGNNKSLTLHLKRDRTLALRLADRAGNPLPGVRVAVDSREAFAAPPEAISDTMGRVFLRVDATQPHAITDEGKIALLIGKFARRFVVDSFNQGANIDVSLALDPVLDLSQEP